jgi:hypothetical protein
MSRARIVDVQDLEPPRPMQVVLDALRALGPDEHLLMRHRREPLPLYPMLVELGFAHRTRRTAAGRFEIRIWRAGEAEPAEDPR